MTKPMIHEHNVSTGVIVEREMTDIEYEQYLIDQKSFADRQAEAEAAEAEAAALKAAAITKLTALGLSEEEAKAIAG